MKNDSRESRDALQNLLVCLGKPTLNFVQGLADTNQLPMREHGQGNDGTGGKAARFVDVTCESRIFGDIVYNQRQTMFGHPAGDTFSDGDIKALHTGALFP